MNMISTGAFLPETDASTKQNELVKKLTAAWEKKNSKTARAGGASLMALSLAACGGEDNTPFSAADVSAAEAAATTAALTGADGTVYASVDAAVTSNDTAIADAARAEGVASVDITTDNQAAIDAAVAAVDLTTDNAAATDAAVAADTAFSSLADLIAAYDAAVAAPAATTTALASTQDIVTMTTSSDTVTGTSTTYTASDVISDASTSDSDTMTITATADITATPTVVNVENIVFNAEFFAAAGNGLDLDADGITNGTITINHTQVGSAADTAVVTNANGVTVVAGTDVDALDVSMNEDAGTIVNAGDASTVTIRSEAGDDQVAVLVANGDVALTVVDTADTMTDLNVTATAASVVTVTNTANLDTITGDANTTIDVGASIANATAFTVTGAAGLVGGANTADLTNVATSVAVDIDTGAASALTVASGANIEFSAVKGAGAAATTNSIIADDAGTSTSSTESTVSITLSDDTTDANNAVGGYSVTLTDSATDGDDEITTLNIAVTGDLDHDTTDDDDFLLVLTDNELATTVNITGGAGGIDMATTTDAANDVTLNASAVTGAVTYTQTDGVGTITTGSAADTISFGAQDVTLDTGAGNDSITLTVVATTAHSVNGGDGVDTLNVNTAAVADADMTTTTLTNIEVLTFTTDASDFLASQMSGKTYTITNGAGFEIDSANSVDLTSIDLSTLTFEDATDVVRVDLTQIATSLTAAQGFTYTGSDAADTVTGSANADTISGGAGVDTITAGAGDDTITGGEGGDTIDTGTGSDTVDLTETTAAEDTVQVGAQGTDVVTITGFTVGGTATADDLELTLTDVEALTAVTNLVSGDGADEAAGAHILLSVTAAGTDIGAAANSILTLDGDYASASALEDALEDGGSLELVFGNFDTAGDSILVAYDDGTDTKIATVTTSAVIADGDNAASGTLTVTDYVILAGVADATDLVAGDLDAIA